eukprot:scaffold3553_cov137-Isochrysis_galbana.AAC.2
MPKCELMVVLNIGSPVLGAPPRWLSCLTQTAVKQGLSSLLNAQHAIHATGNRSVGDTHTHTHTHTRSATHTHTRARSDAHTHGERYHFLLKSD